MPANPPRTTDRATRALGALGDQIRERRKHLKLSATAAAEAAGMSRVTWHRLERGEPSVTMGAYLNALVALGLELQAADPSAAAAAPTADAAVELPATIQQMWSRIRTLERRARGAGPTKKSRGKARARAK